MSERADEINASRRALIRIGITTAAAGTAAVSGVLKFSQARAQVKVSQATAMYQNKPNGTQQCDVCINFIPGKTPTANGTCKKVEGVISPRGWCGLFVLKS